MSGRQSGFSPVFIILFTAVAIAVVGGAYIYATVNNIRSALPERVPAPPAASPVSTSSASMLNLNPDRSTASPSAFLVPSPSPNYSINPAIIQTIKSSFISKNTAALSGYMADKVNVIAEATECCGDVSKTTAIEQLDYLVNDAALPWDFDNDNPIALQLRQKNPAAFPQGIIIGTSANRRLATFTLNTSKTKIIKIYTAVDYKLHGI